MPVEYSGIAKEHTAVRTAAGLFDVSHMGEFRSHGPSRSRSRSITSLRMTPRVSPTARLSIPP